MRPTGPLHLGNLLGALANWVNMQDEYDCYFFIADWHALTSDYDNTAPIENNRKEIMLDWLSAGLTPEKSTLFVQSLVKEHAELFLLLTMITPVPWLERNPTYKEQIGELSNKFLITTQGGGDSEYIRWGYNSFAKYKTTGHCRIDEDNFGFWEPLKATESAGNTTDAQGGTCTGSTP